MIKFVLVILLSIVNKFVYCDVVGDNGVLVMAHVLYRNGDQNPIKTYPTDPYAQSSNWPEGWGELTIIGSQQQYTLGQWLRQRYGNVLISDSYNVSEIYVRSSNKNCALASAQVNLAALYPPSESQMWNPNLNWQPIPVHTVSEKEDYLLGQSILSNSTYIQELQAFLLSSDVQTFNQTLKPMYDYLTLYVGQRVQSFADIKMIRDALVIETIHQKTLPAWTSLALPSNSFMYWGALKSLTMYTDTSTMAKYKSGYLLKEILDRSRNKTLGILNPNYSMYVYSTDDLTIISILNALQVFDNLFVEYAACLMFEIRLYNSVSYVQIYYQNPTINYQLYVPNCGYSCPLDQMYALYGDILPADDYKVECSGA